MEENTDGVAWRAVFESENKSKIEKINELWEGLDGEDFGELSISQGYAFEYTYNNPYSKQNEYKAAQEEAKKESTIKYIIDSRIERDKHQGSL